MRLVLDTNVLIAALIAHGVCADLLEHCVLSHTLVTSEFILDELRGHLVGKFKYTDQEAAQVIALFRAQMVTVGPQSLDAPVCRDSDDDRILGTALAGQVACIVTGDKDLLVLKQHLRIQIISPSEFSDFETQDAAR